MSRFMTATTVLGLLLTYMPAGAQQGIGFELRGVGALPTQDAGDTDLGTGFGFEAAVRYHYIPRVGGYVGVSETHFSPDGPFAGADLDFVETGYIFGLRFEHPFSEGAGASVWARLGGSYGSIQLESPEGDMVSESDSGVGLDAGAGVEVSIGSRWAFNSGIRYHSLARDVTVDAEPTAVDLRYIAVEIGWSLVF